MTAREVLDGINTRLADCRSYNFGMRNADKLAHEDAARLTRAVEAVLELHVEGADWGGGYCSHCAGQVEESVWGDGQYRTIPYPCPTVAAIENALNS